MLLSLLVIEIQNENIFWSLNTIGYCGTIKHKKRSKNLIYNFSMHNSCDYLSLMVFNVPYTNLTIHFKSLILKLNNTQKTIYMLLTYNL